MGSGGSQTLWSPSNEAGAYMRGFLIDTVHVFRCNLAGLKTTPCSDGTVASAVIDGGTLRFVRTV